MVGRTISHYKILDKLGEGGMGVVYKAEDTRLNRLVALKFLSVTERAGEEDKARFAREARAAAALDHPNICTVYEIDEVEGRSFIAMAFLQGRTVQQMVETAPVPIDEALELAIQAAKGLAAAHQSGIVHRDIKSANLMVTSPTAGSETQLKIMDFGLAQLTKGASKLTVEGSTLGTTAFMSPEQARGDKVDHRTDLWSLGVVLHEMLAGQLPFRGEYEQAILYSILHEPPEAISSLRSGVGLELERIVNKALAKDPAERYQTAVDLLVDLRTLKKDRDSGTSRVARPSHVTQAGDPFAQASTRITEPDPPGPSGWGEDPASSASGRQPLLSRTWVKLTCLGVALFAVFVAARLVPPLWHGPMGKGPGAGPPWSWRGRGEPPRVVPITSDAGTESFASFSPDASQVAYTWDGETGDNIDIYVKVIDGGASLRLTEHPGVDTSPAWSPDGRHIAFVRRERRSGGVYLVAPIGGPERKIADIRPPGRGRGLRNLAWSPDAKHLAVVEGGSPQEPGGVNLLAIDTGERTTILERRRQGSSRHSLAFSPNGRALAFVQAAGLTADDIHVVGLDEDLRVAGEPRRVTEEEQRIDGLVWGPEGQSIIFSSERNGQGGLWRVPARGGRVLPLPGSGEGARLPALSADGSKLAYTRAMRDLNIWRLNLQGAAEPEPLIRSTRLDHLPRYSPDGRRIAFVSDRTGRMQVWLAASDGTGAIQLTSYDDGFVTMPNWSSDNLRLAVQVIERDRSHIDLLNVEDRSRRRLDLPDEGGIAPSWSHDGRWIYVTRRFQGVWKFPVPDNSEPGAEPEQVVANGGLAQESPDGKYLFVLARGRREPSLVRVSLETGEETKYAIEMAPGQSVVAETGIYFVGRGTGFQFFDFSDGRVRSLATADGVVGGFPGPSFSVSPDGRSLLYVRNDRDEADLMLVESIR